MNQRSRIVEIFSDLQEINRLLRRALKGLPDAFVVEIRNSHGHFNAFNMAVRGHETTKRLTGALPGLMGLSRRVIKSRLTQLGGSFKDNMSAIISTALALEILALEGRDLEAALTQLGFGELKK